MLSGGDMNCTYVGDEGGVPVVGGGVPSAGEVPLIDELGAGATPLAPIGEPDADTASLALDAGAWSAPAGSAP